jgi:selenocysteine lyase/cysteine desulfurase
MAHSVSLNQRLYAGLDADRYACISPHVDRSPIITFRPRVDVDLEGALRAANVVVSVSADRRIRVSPAVFSNESDIDVLVEALNGA